MMFSAGASSPSENSDVALHHLRRQSLEGGDMRGGHGGVVASPRHPIEALEHAPARGQCRVDVHCPQERIDRPRRILQRDVAVPALLVQAAESRLVALEPLQASPGPPESGPGAAGSSPRGSRTSRFSGSSDSERLGCPQSLGMLAALEKLADAANFQFHREVGDVRLR